MERRGSGIGRILGGYMDFEVKPEFYSDPDFFIVTLPNKGYGIESNAENAKSNAKQQESNVELGETVTFYESEAEQELSAFRTKAENAMPSAKNSSIERIVEMFRRYRCEYAFNRNNVADSFGITPIRASSVIHKMIDCGLARKVKNGEYYFCL
jgi:ATP-dependent DNA helicase RecG